MDELEISGKRYISTRLAAKLHKYHADYIGQLIRAKKVPGQKVGRAWYVDAKALDAYLKGEVSTPARAKKILSVERVEPRVVARAMVEEVKESAEPQQEEGRAEEADEEAVESAELADEGQELEAEAAPIARSETTARLMSEPEPMRAPEPLQSFRRPIQIEREEILQEEEQDEARGPSVFETIAEEIREEESARESIHIPIRRASTRTPSYLTYVDEMEPAMPVLTKTKKSALTPIVRMPRSIEESEDDDAMIAPQRRMPAFVPILGVAIAGVLVFGIVMLSSVFVNSTTIVETGNGSNTASALQAQP
ncbi:MAG TPA: hypothetical protein VG753_01270 [Candidatus Paceibacterota bacterium]|nr:hypothetical protein [Candidatus Paceibacterota bacterium]